MAHIPRVYCPQGFAAEQSLALPRERAHHLHTVLRRSVGDPIRLWNGRGQEATAEITALSSKQALVMPGRLESVWRESPLRLGLAQAVSRGDRFEDTLDAAVELGVQHIQPLWTRFGPKPLQGERLEKKWQSWQRRVLAAAEQAERSQLPEVLRPMPVLDWLGQQHQGWHLDPQAAPLAQTLSTLQPEQDQPRWILVGPEGGLADAEVAMANRCLQGVSIGPRILRTQHAGPALLAVLQARYGDW
jgi:16S rRNA (uracil1498-N3)-methyltransferase